MALIGSDTELDGKLVNRHADAKRGIPEAIFIEDVEALCKERPATDVVARLQELYSKYQYMSSSITSQRASLKVKIPDIGNALETVNHLTEKHEKAADGETSDFTYQIGENIWAKASAPASNKVCLWLGANCMLEYTLEEAVELLRTNDTNAKTMLEGLNEDMAFLRDQITTTEVNIARCHNYGVKQRQKEKDAEEKANPGGNPKAIEGATVADGIAGTIRAAAAQAEAPKQGGYPAKAAEKEEEDTGPFTWKQDQADVEISIRLPPGAEKAAIKVTILADSIKVQHKGQVVLAGQLAARCRPNESTWTMAKNRVDVTLEKAEAEQWPSLFEDVEV